MRNKKKFYKHKFKKRNLYTSSLEVNIKLAFRFCYWGFLFHFYTFQFKLDSYIKAKFKSFLYPVPLENVLQSKIKCTTRPLFLCPNLCIFLLNI